ncbi:helix-turn-helix domain-containing protein [Legionella maioricensis]|uniref:Helix-turn-helix domain-containing protein n=1 Tax=Legionella maioricensis TaxID=2896528 RepID=A0A9X2CXE9_9GAMM|nr:helix-turn-helix transcriptional regulator [Legionella maioricensis]MCL9682573.1 helix-turn-helix domain-containing protein [Legionella maioricensis]MCL9686180.1 helix-turn-helix domain-containing protein [Legionella maioricensis]
MSIQNLKDKAFRNPEVKAEYDLLESQFALIDTLLSMRNKSGLTQDEVAKRMGTQKGNISRLEKGSSNPSWKTIQNYAHACGFEISMKIKTMTPHQRQKVAS